MVRLGLPVCMQVKGDTALILASAKGHTQVVTALLGHGADVNKANVR